MASNIQRKQDAKAPLSRPNHSKGVIEAEKQEPKELLPRGIGVYQSGRSDISINARQILRERDEY